MYPETMVQYVYWFVDRETAGVLEMSECDFQSSSRDTSENLESTYNTGVFTKILVLVYPL